MPAPKRANTFTALTDKLAIGECTSQSMRLPIEEADKIGDVLATLRNRCGQVTQRLRLINGSNFRVEGGAFVTDDKKAIIATCVITKTEDSADPREDEVDDI